MWDTIITFVIVAIVFIWFARYMYRICKVQETSCSCGKKDSCPGLDSSTCGMNDLGVKYHQTDPTSNQETSSKATSENQ